jgi:hypothetical protein
MPHLSPLPNRSSRWPRPPDEQRTPQTRVGHRALNRGATARLDLLLLHLVARRPPPCRVRQHSHGLRPTKPRQQPRRSRTADATGGGRRSRSRDQKRNGRRVAGTLIRCCGRHHAGCRKSRTRAAHCARRTARGSVASAAEACAVLTGAADARLDRAGLISRTTWDQPRWQEEDCRHAVDDLAACEEHDVAAGLELGGQWLPISLMQRIAAPVLLLTPDAPGINELDDTTALRGPERSNAQAALRAEALILDTGHCIHGDDPTGWLHALAPAPYSMASAHFRRISTHFSSGQS